MNYTNEIQTFLYDKGYRRLQHPKKVLLLQENETEFHLIEILPEPLRGQHPDDYGNSCKELEQISNQLMIRYSKKVEALILAIFHGVPDQGVREEVGNCANLWCVDVQDSEIVLFEKQIPDFYGLKKPLETYLGNLEGKEKAEKKEGYIHYITPVNTGIILVNILVFAVLCALGDVEDSIFMLNHGAMAWEPIIDGKEYYRLFTGMFLHFGADHLLQNMFMLFVLGSRLENLVGKLRYLVIYMGAGLIGAVFSLFFTLAQNPDTVAAGASGAIFGVMGGMLFLILKDVIQKKRRYMQGIGPVGMVFMIGCALYFGFTTTGVDNMAHVGGLIGGFILTDLLTIL